jgi:hypothetical protein
MPVLPSHAGLMAAPYDRDYPVQSTSVRAEGEWTKVAG